MPFVLASLSSYLKQCGHSVQVVDAFGEAPWQYLALDKWQIQGLSIQELVTSVKLDTEVCFVYFGGVVAYAGIENIVRELKRQFPKALTVLIENAQAVTASSVRRDAKNLLDIGFDVLLYGDTELTAALLLEHLAKGESIPETDGFVFYRKDRSLFAGENIPINQDLDALPFPDWGSFPLKNYWSLGYAHGPMEGPYLPLLTSRGCPVQCRFCTIPFLNEGKWRARTAKNVVDEIEFFHKRFGVAEFHLEDVNPTVNDKRTVEFCLELIKRDLKIRWKIVAGTKIETMRLETIPLMAKAGCSFVGFAPETGSPDLLKKMNKPFKHELALEMVRSMRANQMTSQAVFVLGFPGETKRDVRLTARYIRRLVFAGVDEIAQYIIAPIPGSAIFNQFEGYKNFSELTFSPEWRKDYRALDWRRKKQYASFFFWKMLRFPHRLAKNFLNVFVGRFKTKMEQALYRVTVYRLKKWTSGKYGHHFSR